MRSPLLLALTLLMLAAPAGAVLNDDEPSNNDTSTAAIQVVPAGTAADVGTLALNPGDADYLGIGPLFENDVVVVSTTPLEDPVSNVFEEPDTVIGVFDDTGTLLCLNDDTFNNDLDEMAPNGFPLGFGSFCRYEILADGDYFVGVTGWSETAFDGSHGETGSYALSVTVFPVPEPGLMLQLGAGLAGLLLLERRRGRKIAA